MHTYIHIYIHLNTNNATCLHLVLAIRCLFFPSLYPPPWTSLTDSMFVHSTTTWIHRNNQPPNHLNQPLLWEKISLKIKAIGAQTKGLKKKIAMWSKAKGLAYQLNTQLGGSGRKPAHYGLANKLVLSKVKDNLGLDQCKFFFSGAAPLTRELLEFFGALGININEAYGMSENFGAVTFQKDDCRKYLSSYMHTYIHTCIHTYIHTNIRLPEVLFLSA
jgi:hypothetical protein